MSVVVSQMYDRPSENHFAYYLYTVAKRIPIMGETTVWAESAQDAVDDAIAQGYAKAEAAPANLVNGYSSDLPVRPGDTASVDIRKKI